MQVTYGLKENAPVRTESSSEIDSEDEWKNQDFFESSVFWNHEQLRKRKPIKTNNQNEINEDKNSAAIN